MEGTSYGGLPLMRQATRKAAEAAQWREDKPEIETPALRGAGAAPEELAPSPKKAQHSPETETPRGLAGERYSDFIGDTPLVELTHLARGGLRCAHVRVFAKCEMFNPGFSIKDRVVANIFSKAEASGRLRAGMTVVAASSGNTGAATAMMCAMRGYKCIITTSGKCSQEKMDSIRAYGAQLLVSPDSAKEGEPAHYMEMARLLALEDPARYFDVDQYDNKENPEGHYLTLGPEIWEQTHGGVTHFICAGSTGGTISGTAKYLKEQSAGVRVVLADPVGSVFTNYFRTGELGKPGKYLVEGVGKGSIPGAMDFSLIDDVLPVTDQEAFDMCHRLCREEGICAGGSSGLNVHAALKLAAELTEPAIIVTVMPDLGVKYLSKVYSPTWLKASGFQVPYAAADQLAAEEEEEEQRRRANEEASECADSAESASAAACSPGGAWASSSCSPASASPEDAWASSWTPASSQAASPAASCSSPSPEEAWDPDASPEQVVAPRSRLDSRRSAADPKQREEDMMVTVESCLQDEERLLAASPLPPSPLPAVDAYRYRDLVGETPLLDLSHLVQNAHGRVVRLQAKCEFFNPGFSIKDRIAQNILNRAEASGALRAGMTVVAASSGNTGAATAMMCAMRGYKCIITTSPKCSQEKMDAIRAYGARLLVSPESAKEGEPAHYMEMARLLALRDPERYFDVDQYESKFNAEGHYLTLGPEVWEQTAGTVTHFVAAGSTGGTISGTGRFLKERNPDVRVVLADPVGSVFTNYFRTGELGKPGKYLVEGVGKGSIPGAMDFSLIDAVQPVSDQEAFDMCFRLCREEGLCAGGSGGLNLRAAMQVANACEEDATIITVLPDLGTKYLSKIFSNKWLSENDLSGPEEPRHVDPDYLPAAARAHA